MEVCSLKWEEVLITRLIEKSRSPIKSEELIEARDDGLNAVIEAPLFY